MNEFYCPSCGEKSTIDTKFFMAPGEIGTQCPKCGTMWIVNIQFRELEEDEK
jgi:predicted RNA-binding Zn-ribbon protein involved in translation (DUF1610 family)